jgi:hypothetical protein
MAKGDLEALLGAGSKGSKGGDAMEPEEDPRKSAAQALIDAVQAGDVDAVLMAFDDLGGGIPSYDVEMDDDEDEEG